MFDARIAAALVLSATPAVAGARPFDTDSPELLPSGAVEAEIAAEAACGAGRPIFPADDGLDLAVPQLGLRTGLGPWGEIRVDGDLYRRFDPEAGAAVAGAGDWRVGMKVRVGPVRPGLAWAASFRAKIPVASDDDGIGTDLADLDARLHLGGDFGSGRWDIDAGIALLGAPFRERAQVDLLTYSGVFRAHLTHWLDVGGEIAGRSAGDFYPARAIARAGIQARRGRVRLDAAAGIGLARGSPDAELRLGVTLPFARGGAGGGP